RPADVRGVFGNAHASFAHELLPSHRQDLRVHQREQPMVRFAASPSVGGDVHEDDAQGGADLRSRDSHAAGRAPHGIEEIVDEARNLLRPFDGSGFFLQNGIGENPDGEDSHGRLAYSSTGSMGRREMETASSFRIFSNAESSA